MEPGEVFWLPAQEHSGENTGATDTHVVFVELKAGSSSEGSPTALGPLTP